MFDLEKKLDVAISDLSAPAGEDALRHAGKRGSAKEGKKGKRVKGEWEYTQNRHVFVPDRKITKPSHVFNYVPVRGYSAHLLVFDIHDRCIGWIDTRTLGYENAKEWIKATGWRDQGY